MRARLALLVVAFLLPGAWASYADLSIVVDASGVVTISGVTNVPELEPGTYTTFTTKSKEYWLLNITTEESLDSFVYAITLPEAASINYLGGKNARLSSSGDAVLVRGSGTSAPFAVAIQYTLPVTRTEVSFAWIPLGVAVVLLAIGWTLLRRQRMHQKPAAAPRSETPDYLAGLPARQRDIISLLRSAGGTLTQRQVELATKLPKSSVSRNVEALRRRGVLKKAQLGMSNTLSLEDAFR